MKGFICNLEKLTEENTDFRHVIYTAPHSQLVLMELNAGEDIGEEVHELDQFIRIESGRGKAVLDGKTADISAGFAVVIPAGTRHNIINESPDHPMKLYTLYSPPEHKDETVHRTKKDAMEHPEHYDGIPTDF